MADAEKSAARESGAPAQEETDTLVGTIIDGRFEIVRRIARGGMGKVYLAEQSPLGREVALKVLHPNYEGDHDPEFHKRFYLEASICSKLTHPNTVTIFDYGQTDDDVYFIAMEYLEGENLRHRLKRERPLPPKNAVKIAAQIARSLREAHSMGVVHRDLKPANIFLVAHDEDPDYVKVLDFGLVKDLGNGDEDLTQTGLFMGSPKYMAPEQIQGEELDGRCDVYSLCVILYEMLTGKVPFHRNNSVNIVMAHINEPPPTFEEANPEAQVPPALEQVVMKGLSKSAGQRFSGMDELLQALKAAAEADNERLSWLSDSTTSGRRSDAAAAVAAVSDDGAIEVDVGPDQSSTVTAFAAGQQHERGGTRKRNLVLGSAAVAMVAALAAAFAIGYGSSSDQQVARDRGEETAPAAAPPSQTASSGEGSPAADEASADEQPSSAASEGPARLDLSLRSDPSGAIVVLGERKLGPTPTDVELTGEQAKPGTELELRFQRAGHRPETVTRTVENDVDSLQVDVELQPRRRRRPSRAAARRNRGGADDDTAAAGGSTSGSSSDDEGQDGVDDELGDYKDAPY